MKAFGENGMPSSYRARVIAIRVGGTAGIVSIWEVSGRFFDNVRFAVGTPMEALWALYEMVVFGRLMYHMAITGIEAIVGIILGVGLGSLLGLALWYSRLVADAARPFLVVAGNAPIFAFAPLLVIWFGVDIAMKIALAFFFTFFLTVSNVHRGAVAVSEDWVNLYEVFGGTKNGAFRRVIVPGALDAVLASARMGVSLGLLGAFVGEFIASDRGLGHIILRHARVFDVPSALAGALAFVFLAFFLDQLAAFVERRRAALLQVIGVSKEFRSSVLDKY